MFVLSICWTWFVVLPWQLNKTGTIVGLSQTYSINSSVPSTGNLAAEFCITYTKMAQVQLGGITHADVSSNGVCAANLLKFPLETQTKLKQLHRSSPTHSITYHLDRRHVNKQREQQNRQRHKFTTGTSHNLRPFLFWFLLISCGDETPTPCATFSYQYLTLYRPRAA